LGNQINTLKSTIEDFHQSALMQLAHAEAQKLQPFVTGSKNEEKPVQTLSASSLEKAQFKGPSYISLSNKICQNGKATLQIKKHRYTKHHSPNSTRSINFN